MKKIFALFALLAMLAACGDESSSSVSPEPRQCEEQSDDCDDVSSSSEKISKNSSSSQKSADKEKSSSSVEKSKSSSSEGKVASSSSKKDENSSSSVEKAKESSSSVKPSSSSEAKSSSSEEVYSSANSSSSGVFDINAPCTYGDVYVEEVDGEKKAYICYEDGWKRYIPKSSSSSVAKSSSSSSIRGYEALPNVPFKSSLSYGEFTDTRDGIKYATIDIDNKYGPDSVHLTFTVFAQNLKYHDKMVLGSEEQDDDTKVEMYCYNDSIEYCNDWWGGLYQWAEMMALPYECNSKNCADLIDPDGDGFHQGICPKGWHLLSEREMLAASYASNSDIAITERANTVKSEISFSKRGGNNLSGMSLIATGFRLNEEEGNQLIVFKDLREATLFDFPAEFGGSDVETCRGGGCFLITPLWLREVKKGTEPPFVALRTINSHRLL